MTETFTNLSIFPYDAELKEKEINKEYKDAESVWKKFIELLSQKLKESEIKTWFSVITPKSFINNTLTVTVPSNDYYGMIVKRFNKQISGILESGLLGENGKLNYEISQQSLFDEQKIEEKEKSQNESVRTSSSVINFEYPYGNKTPKINTLSENPENKIFDSNLNPKNLFDSFVKGESNEFAVAAAYAIANNPGKSYNPYFVYGGVGLGKTHLVQAIGHEILKKYPDKKVYYTTTPDFTTQFTTHIAQDRIEFSKGKTGIKKLDEFFKSLDVLILDDIQNLGGKGATQDFMYQIFNTLYNNKKHLIFSCDKPLSEIKGIEERLISRFKWGITVDIYPPSWEMRVAIIQKKYFDYNVQVPEEVIHYIATNVKDSIRTLEGCVAGTISESTLVYDGEINLKIAENVIKRVIGTIKKAKIVSLENIIFTVADYLKVSENSILSKKRTKEIAFARQVAMYLAKELTSMTLQSIGLYFGGKDHATVLYAYNLIKNLIKKDKEAANIVHDLRSIISTL
ncbi:MAG: chromosomal replication initiator protein DnaA [Ignavibacteria bacterium]